MKDTLLTTISSTVQNRRKALKDFKLSGGHVVPAGEWVAVAAQETTRDPRYYPDPLTFDGFRFAKDTSRSFAEKKLTTWQPEWPFWGSQKQMW